MKRQSSESECLARHFVTAILLSGNVQQAEAAVVDGVASRDLDRTAASALLREDSSLTANDEVGDDIRIVASNFPVELQRVLKLRPDLRRYFVLRTLAGMSRERCASMLKVDVGQVDQGACEAAIQLATVCR